MKSATFIAVAAVIFLLLAAAAGVYAYDSAREDEIADGVTVGGVDVGGLDRQRARARLRAELVEPLRKRVVVKSRGKRFRLTARKAKVRADIDAMLADALRASREGNVLSRTVRDLTGGEVHTDVEPQVSWSRKAVVRLVDRVRRNTERPARDASIDFAAASLQPVPARAGLKMSGRLLRMQIERALVRPGRAARTIRVKVVREKPKVTKRDLRKKYPTVVTVDRGAFTLRLFKDLKLVESYPIAVGQVGLETPAGLYTVQNKAINPAWSVPNSAWAGSLAGQVIPSGAPNNPLKARWLGIYNGAGIHGTDATGSIGTNASHGCIRMLIPHVVELYDRVPVGAPVYIA